MGKSILYLILCGTCWHSNSLQAIGLYLLLKVNSVYVKDATWQTLLDLCALPMDATGCQTIGCLVGLLGCKHHRYSKDAVAKHPIAY